MQGDETHPIERIILRENVTQFVPIFCTSMNINTYIHFTRCLYLVCFVTFTPKKPQQQQNDAGTLLAMYLNLYFCFLLIKNKNKL